MKSHGEVYHRMPDTVFGAFREPLDHLFLPGPNASSKLWKSL